MHSLIGRATLVLPLLTSITLAVLNAVETNSSITLSNERLVAGVSKTRGYINRLELDGQNLLGKEDANGNTGVGPYLDCYCTTIYSAVKIQETNANKVHHLASGPPDEAGT